MYSNGFLGGMQVSKSTTRSMQLGTPSNGRCATFPLGLSTPKECFKNATWKNWNMRTCRRTLWSNWERRHPNLPESVRPLSNRGDAHGIHGILSCDNQTYLVPSFCSISTRANSWGVGRRSVDHDFTTATSRLNSMTTPARRSVALGARDFSNAGRGASFAVRCRAQTYACSHKIQPMHAPSWNETFTHMRPSCLLGRASTNRTWPFCSSHQG